MTARLSTLFILTCLLVSSRATSCLAQPATAKDGADIAAPQTGKSADSYYDIGDFHCKVSTQSKAAQTWFDRGLAMCYAFNHEEAARCFQRALKEDPAMPMALWGLAYAATGRVAEAKAEQKLFNKVRATVPETSALFNNTSRDILRVAEAMIAGEIAYREGDSDRAFEHLREAVRRDDALNYDEPWAWMQPARHALGALLLEQDQVEEAKAVYEGDLKRHPNNVWALHGLAECLARQGKTGKAAAVRLQFDKAAKRTDVKIDRSCYCRTMETVKPK